MSTYTNAIMLLNPGFHLRLGESAGAVAADASPNGRNGNITNCTLGQASLLTDDTANTAFGFNGASSKVVVPYGAWMNATSCTVIAWIKTANAGLQSICDRDGGGPGPRPWQFRMNGGVLNYLQIGGSFQSLSGGASVADNVRHMVGFTVDPTTITLYRDGAVANSGPSGGGPTSDVPDFCLGVNRSPGEGAFFNGTQDEVSYFPGVALTPAQMANLYTIGSNPPVLTGSVTDKLRQEVGMVSGQATSDVMQTYWRNTSGLPVGRSMDDYVKGAGRKWFLDT